MSTASPTLGVQNSYTDHSTATDEDVFSVPFRAAIRTPSRMISGLRIADDQLDTQVSA